MRKRIDPDLFRFVAAALFCARECAGRSNDIAQCVWDAETIISVIDNAIAEAEEDGWMPSYGEIRRLRPSTNVIDCAQPIIDFLKKIGHKGRVIGNEEVWVRYDRGNKPHERFRIAVARSLEALRQIPADPEGEPPASASNAESPTPAGP